MSCITNLHKHIDCQLTLPLSKSIVNRLLVINHIAGNSCPVELISDASDTRTMQLLLREISNKSGKYSTTTEINVGNAGTVMRFLTALLSVTPGKWHITGTERMQQRPIQPLTDALQHLGADLTFGKNSGFPPVNISGNPQLDGGKVQLDAGISSQFISALMMLGPILKGGLTIELIGDIISGSYIRMTQNLMKKCGAGVSFDENRVVIEQRNYRNINFTQLLEPDWSAAAFWYEVAALAPEAKILLKGLREQSVQGDSVLPQIYESLGVNSVFTGEGLLITKSGQPITGEFNYDFTECPDLAQAVIVTCAALGIKGRFSGLKTLRVKETDRIAAIKNELTKLGYHVDIVENRIVTFGKIPQNKDNTPPVVINCYDDHRMAMSFAPLALLHENICLDEPDVVRKSYPDFWKDLEKAGLLLGNGKIEK
ncbi:MAG: 3-phosphoshikimate 1-carboxyvinyltransferase [Bacteroidota bacterium]